MPDTQPTPPVHDELSRHLDWSFWGTGMADVFREPLAEAMLAGITPEQRAQANALITRWRDHREFVGRDKYEAQKAEIETLRVRLWLIEQALQPVTASDDPAGIVGDVGPLLDGPIHPDQIAAYRAARTTTAQAAASPTCGRCRRPFDPDDRRSNGRAQHGDTRWCRACIDRCHDAEDADHRCPICIDPDPFAPAEARFEPATAQEPSVSHCTTPNAQLPCGRHCRHDLCPDCGRCCTCHCADTAQEQPR